MECKYCREPLGGYHFTGRGVRGAIACRYAGDVTFEHCNDVQELREHTYGGLIAGIASPMTADKQPELPGIESTLAERGARYGSFQEHARVTDSLIAVLESGKNWPDMPQEMRQAARVIMDKFGRMVTGDCMYPDNWHDIVGYGRLGEKCAEREPEPTWAKDIARMATVARTEKDVDCRASPDL